MDHRMQLQLNSSRFHHLLVAAVLAVLVVPAAAVEIPKQLPDPDGEPADQSKPVKVFILLGRTQIFLAAEQVAS